MKLTFSAFLLSVFSAFLLSTAFATERKHDPAGTTQTQGQSQDQAQAQRQGQSQSANSASESASEATSVNDNSVKNHVGQAVSILDEAIRQAPAASAAAGITTSQCYHDVRLGFSTPVGGVTFGKGRKSQDCFRLQLAQYLYERGNDSAGDRVMCTITEVREALGADCLGLVRELHPVKVSDTGATEYVTKQELAQRDDNVKRALSK